MQVELYTKTVSPKGKVNYQPYTPSRPDCIDDMTDGQLVTLAVSAGVTCLMMMERMLPEHKRNARQIKKVEEAILALAKGNGEPVDNDIMDYWAKSWNKSMEFMQSN